MAKRKDNTEFILDVMNFSEHGALSQSVVMTSVEGYVKHVVEMGEEKFTEEWKKNALISSGAWFATCKEIHEKFIDRYKKEGY